ncbi:MAG: 1,4-dihydroxy-2-naphthoate octaprenyltransferase [Pyrodictiaceae archaeon]
MPSLKQVFIATRPWSFVMTIISIVFGASYAYWLTSSIDLMLVLVALVGSVLLHAAVNVWNDYYDYKYRFDRPGVGTAIYRPHPLIEGYMTPGQVMALASGSAIAALAFGAYIALAGRPLAILLGLLGLLLAFFYTGPPLRYKYHGFGEVGVFTAWGPLMVLGSYYVASGRLGLEPIIASIPIGLLVAAVLLANNIRDIETDKEAGARTLAVILGRRRAIKAYQGLLLTPYAIVALLTATKLASIFTLLVLLTLPQAIRLARLFVRQVPPDADPRTAMIVQNFGILYIIGTILGGLLGGI